MSRKRIQKRWAEEDICAYCAKRPSRPGVGDHVIPRCLFAVRTDSIVTVPACTDCNGKKANDEADIRDWLRGDIEVDEASLPQSVRNNFSGSVARGSSRWARSAIATGRFKPRLTESGIYVGHAFAYDFDSAPVKRVFKRVAQGLYYDATHPHQHLPETGQYEIGRIFRAHMDDQVAFLTGPGMDDPVSLGNGVCDFMRGGFHTDTHIVFRGLLMFYNRSVAVDVRVIAIRSKPEFRPGRDDGASPRAVTSD